MTGARRASMVVAAAALVVTSAGLLIGLGVLRAGLPRLDHPVPPLARLAVGVGIALIAQLARLTIRSTPRPLALAWGEAAIIVLCGILPLPWIPAVLLLGVGGAQLLLSTFTRRHPVWLMVSNTANLVIAGTTAAIVTNLLGDPLRGPMSVRLALAMVAGALSYTVVAAVLVSVGIATGRAQISASVLGVLRSKQVMLVGNVVVGICTVALAYLDRRWLLLLPPVVWLLHQTYAYWIRGDDERRTWRAFSDATRALNRLDPQETVHAALRGLLQLFPARSAELALTAGARVFSQRAGGEIVAGPEPDRDGQQMCRELMVGEVRVGRLVLWLRPSTVHETRNALIFAAFGDALAAALHDAATNEQLRTITARTNYEAAHDPLTGVANRAEFLTRGNALLRTLGADAPVALLLLDIDHFRQVNDTLGHAAGDRLLQVIAQRLGGLTGPSDLLARLGGDEFVLLTTQLPAAAPRLALPGERGDATLSRALDGADHPVRTYSAMERARRIAEEVAAPSEVAGVQLSVEASVGVAVSSAGGVDTAELLRRADIAMYQAKRGGESIAWYDPGRDEASTDRLALLAELREALSSRDQLILLLQPAVGLDGAGATGVEALVRWRHPRRGTLEPADFVPVVELSELIRPFTRYVLDRALELAAGWAAQGITIPVSVNLSARSLLDPGLPDDVAALLHKHAVPPARLVLEITETVVMSQLPVIDRVLTGLRAVGVQLAVDDFGTGYSSLTFLTRVPVDEVKVDRAFVRDMAESAEAAAIVRTTIDLARRLGLRVVAEGVETAEQRTTLAELGCTAAQGFHFYPPLVPDRVVEVLRTLGVAPILPLRAEA